MKFGKRLTIMERTFKDRGEVAYIVSPEQDFFSAPVIPSRAAPFVLEEFKTARQQTLKLCEHLYPEDVVLDTEEARSIKWYLAHATWVFENTVLKPYLKGYIEFNPHFEHLFAVARGPFSRPTLEDIYAYRTYVDAAMEDLLFHSIDEAEDTTVQKRVLIALRHEAKIQERILTDIKHHFSLNILQPAYEKSEPSFQTEGKALPSVHWIPFSLGLYNIGADEEELTFDYEKPRHTVYIHPFALAQRLVTNREYREFIEDGGYRKKDLWLSEGWRVLQQTRKRAPFYWKEEKGEWFQFTLRGLQPLIENEPVSHVSYYEAAAFAKWADARLPTEVEWELAASLERKKNGNFFRPQTLQPVALKSQELKENQKNIFQLFGDAWEWTSSAFLPYPGFQPKEDFTEFSPHQLVLRGGSCLTQEAYYSISSRYPLRPSSSLACSSIRLAKDAI